MESTFLMKVSLLPPTPSPPMLSYNSLFSLPQQQVSPAPPPPLPPPFIHPSLFDCLPSPPPCFMSPPAPKSVSFHDADMQSVKKHTRETTKVLQKQSDGFADTMESLFHLEEWTIGSSLTTKPNSAVQQQSGFGFSGSKVRLGIPMTGMVHPIQVQHQPDHSIEDCAPVYPPITHYRKASFSGSGDMISNHSEFFDSVMSAANIEPILPKKKNLLVQSEPAAGGDVPVLGEGTVLSKRGRPHLACLRSATTVSLNKSSFHPSSVWVSKQLFIL